jgi:hypothetical protein
MGSVRRYLDRLTGFRFGLPGCRPVLVAVSEDVAGGVGVEAESEPGRAAPCREAEGGVAVAIIGRAPRGVPEHGEGLADFLEARFRRRVARIAVGVVPERERAVRELQIAAADVLGDAESLVEVRPGHGRVHPSVVPQGPSREGIRRPRNQVAERPRGHACGAAGAEARAPPSEASATLVR